MALINSSMIYCAILLVAALSGLISEKAGVINVAIDGMMIIGALLYKIFGNVFHGYDNFYTFIPALLLAAIGTALFSLLHGFITIKLKANHVVSGTAINLFAAGLALFITKQVAIKFPHNDSDSFRGVYDNPYIEGTLFQVLNIALFVFALFIALLIWAYFKFTKFGFRHATVGENPNAADSAGVNVIMHKWVAVVMSGFLAGLAGAIAMTKMATFRGDVAGLGFVALGIMILGQWRVEITGIATIAFAFLYSVGNVYEIPAIPADIMQTLPFVLSLISLVALSKFQNMPQANGVHFDKSKR